jgi:hypothetical protein
MDELLNYDTSDESLETLSDTLENLMHSYTVIKEHGLSTPLIAFMDTDKILSSNIEEFPSIEAYTLTPDKYTTELALEGLLTNIRKTGSRWYKAVKKHIIKYRQIYAVLGVIAITALAVILRIRMDAQRHEKIKSGEVLRSTAIDISAKFLNTDMKRFPGIDFKFFDEHMTASQLLDACYHNVEQCQHTIKQFSAELDKKYAATSDREPVKYDNNKDPEAAARDFFKDMKAHLRDTMDRGMAKIKDPMGRANSSLKFIISQNERLAKHISEHLNSK